MKTMDMSVNKKRIKPSKIVALVATILLVVATVGAVIIGSMLPKSKRLYPDAGTINSVTATSTDEWFYTTSMGAIYRLNEQDEIVETFDLAATLKEKGEEDCGKVDIYFESTAEYIYVTTASKLLVQLKDENGALSVVDYTNFKGSVLRVIEREGELYVLREQGSYYMIDKFNANDLSKGVQDTGYIYDGSVAPSSGDVNLKFIKQLSLLSFEVVEEATGKYLYLVYTDGIVRISTDFKMNQWQDKIPALINEKYNAFYEEEKKNVVNENEIDVSELKKRAEKAAFEELGVLSFKGSGEVNIKGEFFDSSLYSCYSPTTGTYSGCAFVEEENKYYLLGKEGFLYSYDYSNIANMEMGDFISTTKVNVNLAGEPGEQGNWLFYDKESKIAYVVYFASDKLTCLDLDKETVLFTTTANFDIKSIIQNDENTKIHYIYTNANEAASSENILRSLTIGGQADESVLRPCFVVLIIFAILSAIVLLFALLCAFLPGFSGKFIDVMQGFRKHWALYLVLAGCFSLVALFCYYPAVGSIRLSFFDYTLKNPSELWNNFGNYKELFTSIFFMEEFTNTFFFLFCDLFIALLPPLIFAFFLTIMRSKKYSALMRTLLFIPGVIPGIATTLIWSTGIYGGFGALNTIIKMFGGTEVLFLTDSLWAKWSLVLMGFPYVGSYLIFYGAMMNVPDSYYEAAELDGITVIKRFIFIDIPLIFAQIKYVLIMSIIASVQNFGRIYMVTKGGYKTRTLIYAMYEAMRTHGDYGLAAAYATVLFIFLFAVTVLNFRMQRKDNEV